MTQPNNPIAGASARMLVVATQVVDFLVARQGQGKVARTLESPPGLCSRRLHRAVFWIRDNFQEPDPLLSSRDGYEVSLAWRPNVEFFVWRFKIIDTYLRITRRTVIEALRARGLLDAEQTRLLNQVDNTLQFTGTTMDNLIVSLEAQLRT
jgi:hypothetical protein